MAPTYANCLMYKFEMDHILNKQEWSKDIHLWTRYIDDIFGVWTGTETAFDAFFEYLNNIDRRIQFTRESSHDKITFLDVKIEKKETGYSTTLFRKITDRNNLLHRLSFHQPSLLKNLPYSQLVRVKKIVSDPEDCIAQQLEMKAKFLARGYKREELDSAAQRANTLDRDTLLSTPKKTKRELKSPIQAEDTFNGQSIEHQKTTFVKQLKLGKLPQCLCIHLQRLSWSNEGIPLKRHDHVQFNEFLMLDFYKYHLPGKRLGQHHLKPREHAEASNDIKAGTTKPQALTHPNTSKTLFTNGAFSPSLFSLPLTPTPLKVIPDYSSSMYLYRLVAVVVHHGDMHSGHFVTYRRSPTSLKSSAPYSNQWLWISDDTVRKASLQEVLSSNAYLLFYERVHTKVWRSGQDVKAEE